MDGVPFKLGPRGRRWFDIALTSLILLLAVPAGLSTSPSVLALGIFQVAPLFWRRRFPVSVFAVVYVAHALQVGITDEPLPGQLAFPIAVYSVARWRTLRFSIPVLGLGLIAALVASWDWFSGDYGGGWTFILGNSVGIGMFVVVAWSLGMLGRTRDAYVASLIERSERVAREADQQAQLAAQNERNRIAREMHDVVAHGLSMIIVQADGARYAAANRPDLAVQTLDTIAKTGREAMAEMRTLLGLLRSEDGAPADEADTPTAPQPDLADLADLLQEASASMTIEAELDDDVGEEVPAVVALTAYRLVQEALTNVRKHAGPQVHVHVAVRREDRALRVIVTDDGRGASADGDGQGHGLVGMRERVAAHGGQLSAGPVVGGGYQVDARMPW